MLGLNTHIYILLNMGWLEWTVVSVIIFLPHKSQIKESSPLSSYLAGETHTIVLETDYADWLSY